MRTLRLLDALAIVLALAAAIIAFVPARVDTARTARGVIPAETASLTTLPQLNGAHATDTGTDAALVVSANVLSGSRKAPSVRYVSPENLPQTGYEMPAAFQPAPSPDVAAGDSAANRTDAVPTLYGIVSNNGTWQALLRLSADDAAPVLLREGDRRGAYRVVSIASDRVVVANSAGQRTLRLARPRNDSTTLHP